MAMEHFPPMRRVEDITLLLGRERFIHDITYPDMLHARFLRSSHAHAKITERKITTGEPIPGFWEVFLGKDLNKEIGPIPVRGQIPPELDIPDLFHRDTVIYPLADEVVQYVGQPYGVVLAETPYLAEDAADRVQVRYEPLPVISSISQSLSGETILQPGWSDNIAARVELRKGDAHAALARADVVLEETFYTGRCAATPMETRGIVANFDEDTNTLTVWTCSQVLQSLQSTLCRLLSLTREQVVVRAPAIGGAFGVKCTIYPEDLIIPYLSFTLKRPIAWIEDRLEHFAAAAHAREQLHKITLAANRDGTFIALHDEFYLDGGAYNPSGIILPYNTASHLHSAYDFPHLHVQGSYVLTNKAPTLAYRGAGRPEAVFALERAIDRLARKLSIDPLTLREKNLIPDGEQPYDMQLTYRDGQDMEIDSRSFRSFLKHIEQTTNYWELRKRQEEQRKNNSRKRIGIGLASYVEGTGIGPFETARVVVRGDGTVEVSIGVSSHGQGHKTFLTQVCAKALQIAPERIEVITGEPARVGRSMGTYASRVGVLAGSAVWEAAHKIIEKSKTAASNVLEVDREDLDYSAGVIFVKGYPERKVELSEIVLSGVELDEIYEFSPRTVTFGGGIHAAVIEVDLETNEIDILRYVVTHDGGIPVNMQIVEGQIHGGVAQGIGEALFESIKYDERGQLKTRTMMDYLVPTACEIPAIEIHHVEIPSLRNPLGLKGVGEAGAICPPAVLANALEDALGGEYVNSAPLVDELV